MAEIVVIGSGIAGIACSIRLAAKGHKVNIYEANQYPGGKLTSFKNGEYRFDAGPSLFTMPQLVTDLFELCGENPNNHFTFQTKEHICKYHWDDGMSYRMPAGKKNIIQSMANTFQISEKSIEKYLNTSEKKYNLTSPVFLEQSLHKWANYLNLKTLKAFLHTPILGVFNSLHSYNKKYFKDEKVVQLFDRFATYNGSSPYRTPAIMSMIPHLEMGLGTFFPNGGMVAITNSLVKLAERQGVHFHFGNLVSKITINNGKATGIVVDDREITSDYVISNMDIFTTYRKLLAQESQPEKILNQERSSSALIFYWGMNTSFPELDLHNIFFSNSYQEEFEAIFNQKSLHKDPTVYVNISAKCNPADAPNGGENWFVMINTPGDFGQDWDNLIAKSRNIIQNKIKRALGKNISDFIVTEDILHPRLIEKRTKSHRGALYGTSSNNRYAAFLRHPNFAKKIKNLYFCGGSVHPGGGIPLCLHSAKIVSNLF